MWCYEWVRFYRFTKHDSTKTGARKIIIKTIIDRGCNHLHACKIKFEQDFMQEEIN